MTEKDKTPREENRRHLIIAAPTGYGMCLAVRRYQQLKQSGIEAEVMIGSWSAYGGRSTHANVFFSETLPKIDLTGIGAIDLCAVRKNERDSEGAESVIAATKNKLNGEVSFIENYDGNDPLMRIGGICQRDKSVLPITEDELELATGLDFAMNTPTDDPIPDRGNKQMNQWLTREDARMKEVWHRLLEGDWQFFRDKAKEKMSVPTALVAMINGVAIVDTSNPGKMQIGKMMEMAIRTGQSGWGGGIALKHLDLEANLGEKQTLTIIQDWLIPGESLEQRLRDGGLLSDFFGPADLKTKKYKVGDRNFVSELVRIIELLGDKSTVDMSGVRKIIICGDPNSGKSVFRHGLSLLLESLNVPVKEMDLDIASPTPADWLEGKALRPAKREPTEKLGVEALTKLKEVIFDGLVIGDIAGGQPETDDRWGPRAYPLQAADGVVIVSRTMEGINAWRKIVEGLENKPRVLGEYLSQQGVSLVEFDSDAEGEKVGRVSNLRREKRATYNPVVVLMGLLLAKGRQSVDSQGQQ